MLWGFELRPLHWHNKQFHLLSYLSRPPPHLRKSLLQETHEEPGVWHNIGNVLYEGNEVGTQDLIKKLLYKLHIIEFGTKMYTNTEGRVKGLCK